MNRAVGRRPFFESEREIRSFLALLAWSVKKSWIEVHSFAVLPNHFHLLVRSPTGRLSRAMAWIQSNYVTAFNRTHDRDGPLVRGRFRSKRTEERAYRHLLVGYIDWNPVAAGLCATPEAYHYGSARSFIRGRPRPWLRMELVEDLLAGRFESDRYRRAFRPSPSQIELCERRIELGDRVASGGVRGFPSDEGFAVWMRKRALLADGDVRRLDPVLGASGARDAVVELALGDVPRASDPRVDVPGMLLVGLLRSLSSMTFASIASTLGLATQTAHRRWGRHRDEMEGNPAYREFVIELSRTLVQREREMC